MSELQAIIDKDRRDALASIMTGLVKNFGLILIMDVLQDEAAKQIIENYNGTAVKVHDVLRATKELINGD